MMNRHLASLALDEDSPYTKSCLFTLDQLPLLLLLRKNQFSYVTAKCTKTLFPTPCIQFSLDLDMSVISLLAMYLIKYMNTNPFFVVNPKNLTIILFYHYCSFKMLSISSISSISRFNSVAQISFRFKMFPTPCL